MKLQQIRGFFIPMIMGTMIGMLLGCIFGGQALSKQEMWEMVVAIFILFIDYVATKHSSYSSKNHIHHETDKHSTSNPNPADANQHRNLSNIFPGGDKRA